MGCILLLFFMLKDSLSQPDVESLEGGFKEIAFARNEQNTGPVTRIYSVSVADTGKANFELYGNYMPHTKYGTTIVYFFLQGERVPGTLNVEKPYFDDKTFHPIVRYEKDAMGGVKVTHLKM